jgi:hypothetical protein
MNYAVIRGDQFMEDVYWRARWYTRKAGTDVAQKFEATVVEGSTVYVFRLMHGARDLGRRLLQPND